MDNKLIKMLIYEYILTDVQGRFVQAGGLEARQCRKIRPMRRR